MDNNPNSTLVTLSTEAVDELRYLRDGVSDTDSISALDAAIGALTTLPLTAAAQAALHHRGFPGLPEGYTHDDIDRLFEWANEADDFLYSLSRKVATPVIAVPLP